MPEPIRWGILSTANIATKVGSAIQSAANANLLAIASRCENKAREWAELKGVPKYYGCYNSLLNDQEIDAVYIPYLQCTLNGSFDQQNTETRIM